MTTLMMHGGHLGHAELENALADLMMSVIAAFSSWRIGQHLAGRMPLHDHRIQRAVAYMRANVGNDINIDAVAREACLSRAPLHCDFPRTSTEIQGVL